MFHIFLPNNVYIVLRNVEILKMVIINVVKYQSTPRNALFKFNPYQETYRG